MAVPERSTEQRRAASQRAVLARRRRADVAGQLKTGALGLGELLELAQTDEAVAGMRVSAVLAALPRMGPRRSAEAMTRLRISPSRRLRGLGSAQRGALIDLAGPTVDSDSDSGKAHLRPDRFADVADHPDAPHGADAAGGGPPGGRLTVLSGPSGVGKGTVVAAVRRRHPSIWVSVSVTTRVPRPGEVNGVHYRFVTTAEYDRMVAAGELLEHATFAGNGYGTPRGPVEQRVRAGLPTLLEIELQGARQIRERDPAAQLVFLLPPSWAELEHRLRARGTETEAVVAARLARARLEMTAVGEFDAQIVNDDVERAAAELVSLVQSACASDPSH